MSHDNPHESTRAPLLAHLAEFKQRVFYSAVALLLGMGLSYYFAAQIYEFLLRPLAAALPHPESRRMIYTGLTEAFFTYVKLAFFGGFILAFPVIIYQAYRFVAPGLYAKEKQSFVGFILAAPILFLAGAALAYYGVLPMAWKFFVGFETAGGQGSLPIQLEARVSEYLSLIMHIVMAFGLAFQLPVVLALLAKMGVITAQMLKQGRRFAIVGVFVIAAIVTPPDVVSQLALAVPMLILYELSILVCRKIEPKDEADEDLVPKPEIVSET